MGLAYSDLAYKLEREFAALQANGHARIATVFGTYPLRRTRQSNMSIGLSLEAKTFQDRIDAEPSVTDKRAQVAVATWYGDQRDAWGGGGLNSYFLAWSTGTIDIRTTAALQRDADTARSDGHYNKLAFSLSRVQRANDSLTLSASLSGQMASKNLDVSEKMELGGMYGVRAYPEGEAYADEGLLLTLEARQQLRLPAGATSQVHYATARGCMATSTVFGAAPSSRTLDGGRTVWAWRSLPLAVMLAWVGLAVATLQGGVVSAGGASISQVAGQTTITQTTPHVAINWQSFGVAAGQSVQFVQPGRSALALNRVTGADPSAILGRLSANGQVFLVNPNGILFGPGASVDVGGLVASTLSISDADFMAGRYRFSGAGAAELRNQGALQAASGGYVALLGAQVNNQGIVVAPRGSVTMAAGQAMTLDVLGDRLLSVRVDQGVANALLNNGGLLQADGGQVLMSTQAAGNLQANAVNNTGVVQAQTVENRQGNIVLLGSMDIGTVSLGGTLDVSAGPGQKAGRVLATGHQVGLFDAHILASGGSGGGQVLIGGGYQGRDLAVPHAQAVYMSAGATIEANARDRGDGGQS